MATAITGRLTSRCTTRSAMGAVLSNPAWRSRSPGRKRQAASFLEGAACSDEKYPPLQRREGWDSLRRLVCLACAAGGFNLFCFRCDGHFPGPITDEEAGTRYRTVDSHHRG